MLKKLFSILFYIGAGFFLLFAIIMFFVLDSESGNPLVLFFLFLSVCLILIGYGISKIGKQKKFTSKTTGKIIEEDTNLQADYKRMYKNEDIGMFFMDLSESIKRKNIANTDTFLLSDYYFMLGCVCQGRMDEVEEWYKQFLEDVTNDKFIEHITLIKPNLIKLGKVAKRIEDAAIKELEIGESIGDYQNKKALNSKVFMREYHYLRSFNYNDIV